MPKSLKETLDEEGLVIDDSSTPANSTFGSATAAENSGAAGAADAEVGVTDAGWRPMTAPSVGSGKMKNREDLVQAAADAFRRAANAADSLDASTQGADAERAQDLQFVSVRPKKSSSSDADVPQEPKVVVFSKSSGKIIGRQG